jgi:transposase InsO family protein
MLRSNNGFEYTSRQFKGYLVKEGIKHHLTMPYTTYQNGVSERRTRTLMEKARCLLYEKKMPLKYWVEAMVIIKTTKIISDFSFFLKT